MGQEKSKATKAKAMKATHSGVGLLGEFSKVEDAEMLGQADKEEEDVLDWFYARWGKQTLTFGYTKKPGNGPCYVRNNITKEVRKAEMRTGSAMTRTPVKIRQFA